MINSLQPIILQKELEVYQLKSIVDNQPGHAIAQILQGKNRRVSKKSLRKALRGSTLSIIAEVKRKSPSKGALAAINDPVSLARSYVGGGANVISILTDQLFFGGTLDDLTQVALALQESDQPILRKDFIIDEIQIAEAVMAGADAILCIVAVLGDQMTHILHAAKTMGIEVLVEVHDEAELETALANGAEIIGVNNRNLKTMQIDTQQAFKLLEKIPPHIVKVAESGILQPELAQEYFRAGFDAVLIGEALVKSGNPEKFMEACRYVPSLN